jgi:hypothetical protein
MIILFIRKLSIYSAMILAIFDIINPALNIKNNIVKINQSNKIVLKQDIN